MEAVKKIYPELDVEVCLFGYILFEMGTGRTSPTPSPLDYLHELPRKLDPNITNILGRIFGDKSVGSTPTIEDLINDPLFNATNVPKGDTSLFTALRDENEMVNKLRNAALNQCYHTYSMEALLGDKETVFAKRTSGGASGGKKKKKKKKKKNRKKGKNKNKDEELVDESEMSLSRVAEEESAAVSNLRADSDDDIFKDVEDDESSDHDLWSSQ